jgi:pimeloyl-ACP methyl ester carboxylesterase
MLSDEYRVVTIDLPGQGLTVPAEHEDYSYERMVSFVDEVVAELGLPRFAIGGSSFGGLIAARYAIVRPHAISELVLVSAAGIQSADSRPPTEIAVAQIPVVRQIFRLAPMRLVFEGYLKEMVADDRFVTEELIERYWDLNRGRATVQMRRVGILGERGDSESQFLRARLAEIRAPALVLGGEEDRGTPPSSAEFFASAIPSARLILYEGVGHFPMLEAAEQTSGDVRSFLAGNHTVPATVPP